MFLSKYTFLFPLLFFLFLAQIWASSEVPRPRGFDESPPPEMLVIHQRTGRIKKSFQVGKKLAYWTRDSRRKKRGIMTYIGQDSVQFNQHRYAWEEITAVSPSRYHRGLREFMAGLGVAGLAWGGFILILMLSPEGQAFAAFFAILLLPSILVSSLSFGLTRKFSTKKFHIISSSNLADYDASL